MNGVKRALDNVSGTSAQGIHSRFHLSASEIIDINAEFAGSSARVLSVPKTS